MINVTADYPFVGDRPFDDRAVPEFQVRKKHGFSIRVVKNESSEVEAIVYQDPVQEDGLLVPMESVPELPGTMAFTTPTPTPVTPDDGLIIKQYAEGDTEGRGRPVAWCRIPASVLDICDHWHESTPQERSESVDRYLMHHTPDWIPLVTPRHHLDQVLDSIPVQYQHSRIAARLRSTIQLADQSPIYAHFAREHLSVFQKELQTEIKQISDLSLLMAKYSGILILELGHDACESDHWYQAFFV